MRVSLIAAVAKNGVIGDRGRIPWRLSDDLRRFKNLTLGHVLLMGRRTFDSIGRPLPGRRTIVLSRSTERSPEGVEVARDVDQALRLAAPAEEVFVAGGEEIYRLLLPRADRLLITWVDAAPPGDARWPEVDWPQFELVEASAHAADDRNQHASRFEIYCRRPSSAPPPA